MPEIDRRKGTSKPAYSEGKIAIWPRETPGGVAVWNIRENRESGPLLTSCYAEVSGYALMAEEAAAIYRGDDVIATLQTKDGNRPYDASLFNGGIKVNPKQVGDKVYENRTLQIGIALRVQNAKGQHTGFLVDGVSFPVYLKGGVQLEGGECWKMIEGKTIEKDGFQIKIDNIKEIQKETRVFKNAEMSVKIVDERQQRPVAELIKTNDGLTVRTFRSQPRGDETQGVITGFRVTRGGDSARDGVSFRAYDDDYTLNAEDAAELFRGEILRGERLEIRMTGVIESPSPKDATRIFKNAELEVVKIQQAEDSPSVKVT